MAKNTQSTKSIVVLFLIFGFFYTFSYKLQGSQIVHQGVDGTITKKFFHPYMQGLSLFIGQALCLLVLYFESDESVLPKNHSPKIFIIPGLSDLISSMMQCSALALISGSSFMLLKGGSIVTTLIFSYWLIDLKIRSRHVVGCGLAILGLAIVGIADIFVSQAVSITDSSDLQTIGYFLMVTSTIFNGFLYAYEQKLVKQYKINPLHMVGWQGVYASITAVFLVIFFSFVPCLYTGYHCVYSSSGFAYTEMPSEYFSQMFSSFPLFILIIAGILCSGLYDYYGVTITQTMDSMVRSLLNVCRTALIWMVGIFVSLSVNQESLYRIQSLKLSVNLVKLIGFVSMISGTLIYNQVILVESMKRLDDKLFAEHKQDVEMKLINQEPGLKLGMELQNPEFIGLSHRKA